MQVLSFLNLEPEYAGVVLSKSRTRICRCFSSIKNQNMQVFQLNQEPAYAGVLAQSRTSICRCFSSIKNQNMQMLFQLNQEPAYAGVVLAQSRTSICMCFSFIKSQINQEPEDTGVVKISFIKNQHMHMLFYLIKNQNM